MIGGLWRRIRTLALTDVSALWSGRTSEALEQLERVLVEADFGPAAYELLESLEADLPRGDLRSEQAVRDWLVRRIAELLEVFELTSWKDELVEAYSHGMRQKLIISSALIHRPECIVVDEPMVGLDPKAARLLKDIFRQFVGRGGTVLMSTHTLEVAEAMCDQIAIIQHGKIVAAGTMAELRRQHQADASLEELFLKLTGGAHVRELAEVLGAGGGGGGIR